MEFEEEEELGKEKMEYIRSILKDEDRSSNIQIIDLSNNSNAPNFKKIKSLCIHHSTQYHMCTQSNSELLYKWIVSLLPDNK